MTTSRWVILTIVGGGLLLSGCGERRWDWWRKPKQTPAGATADDRNDTVDEKLLDEVMSDDGAPADQATSAPSTGSQPTSGPVGRKQWASGRKEAATRPSRSRNAPDRSIQTPILFVNDEVMTAQEVLEPLLPKFEEVVKHMSLVEYRRFVLEELKRRVVRLRDELLAYGEAKKEITDEMEPAITKAVDQTERRRINAEFGGRSSRYEAYLAKHGLSRDEVRRRIRRELVVRQYLKDKFLPLIEPPTRRELLKYYEKRPEEFTEPERAEMFVIDVPYWAFLEGSSAKEREAMWAKIRGPRRVEARRAAERHIERARQELASGIPFKAVAQSYSFGPNAQKGGAWGFVSPGGLTGRWVEAARALFELRSGQLSDVIRTEAGDGLMLVKAGKRLAKRVIPFVEAQPTIEEKLVKVQERKLEEQLLFKLRTKSTIGDIASFFAALNKAVPKHPDQQRRLDLNPTR